MGQMAGLANIDQARAAKDELSQQIARNSNVTGIGLGGNAETGHHVVVNLRQEDPALEGRFSRVQGVPVKFKVVGEITARE